MGGSWLHVVRSQKCNRARLRITADAAPNRVHGTSTYGADAPGDEALRAQLVGGAGLGPAVGGVDGAVAVHVGAVLVGKAVHAVALALLAMGEPGKGRPAVSRRSRRGRRHHKCSSGSLRTRALALAAAGAKAFLLTLRPWESTQPFLSMKRDLPIRLLRTVSFSTLFRPTSLMLVLSLELRTTRLRRAALRPKIRVGRGNLSAALTFSSTNRFRVGAGSQPTSRMPAIGADRVRARPTGAPGPIPAGVAVTACQRLLGARRRCNAAARARGRGDHQQLSTLPASTQSAGRVTRPAGIEGGESCHGPCALPVRQGDAPGGQDAGREAGLHSEGHLDSCGVLETTTKQDCRVECGWRSRLRGLNRSRSQS